jgi:hypothetical protein
MASVARDDRGWRILFTAPDRARKTLRLGRVDRRAAESIRGHVEALLVAKTAVHTWFRTGNGRLAGWRRGAFAFTACADGTMRAEKFAVFAHGGRLGTGVHRVPHHGEACH